MKKILLALFLVSSALAFSARVVKSKEIVTKENIVYVGEEKVPYTGVVETYSARGVLEEKTEFKVGDIIAFDGKELTVEKVERNWDSGNTYMKPKDGKEYVKVTVKIENKSETEMSYNVFEFKAEDSNGAAESADGQTYSLPDSLGSGDLVKGGKKTGSMIFEVPAGSQIKLHYQPSFWSNKKVIVNL